MKKYFFILTALFLYGLSNNTKLFAMKLTERRIGDIVVIELSGKMMGGPESKLFSDKLHELIKEGKTKIVVDLKGVYWMNDSGLGILIGGLTTMQNSGGYLKVANITYKIQSLLMITRLVTVFESFDTVNEAIESFTFDSDRIIGKWLNEDVIYIFSADGSGIVKTDSDSSFMEFQFTYDKIKLLFNEGNLSLDLCYEFVDTNTVRLRLYGTPDSTAEDWQRVTEAN